MQDGLGSVRLTVDDTGAPIGTREWDAWGNLRSSTGSGYGFGWAGEQYDASSDLTYLRARFYSPGTGQFLSRDTVQPNNGTATGYNPYAYAAAGNPVTHTDPSGHLLGLGDFGGGIAGAFLYLAYVFECFLSGNCRFQGEHGGDDGELNKSRQPGCGALRITSSATFLARGHRLGSSCPGSKSVAYPISHVGYLAGPCGYEQLASVGTLGLDVACGGGGNDDWTGGTPDPVSERDTYILHWMFDVDIFAFLREKATPNRWEDDVIEWGDDGCSIPGWVVFIHRFEYEETSHNFACERHDFGYRNVAEIRPAMRGAVDSQLHTDANAMCDKKVHGWFGAPHKVCLFEATLIYQGVDKGGEGAWKDAQT